MLYTCLEVPSVIYLAPEVMLYSLHPASSESDRGSKFLVHISSAFGPWLVLRMLIASSKVHRTVHPMPTIKNAALFCS